MTVQQKNRVKIEVQKAIQDPESVSLHFIYITENKVSIRAVSPYRWEGSNAFVGLCLSTQNHRSFRVDRIHKIALVDSADLLMPFQITEVKLESFKGSADQAN
ncbi:MAG: WYL domain-containing protein [Planctomycetota bacterium]|jgi:predicted DNA-binding transcriptional regulator YafY|nr:WYL domain-containing protein [Planctomycetota bacterium]